LLTKREQSKGWRKNCIGQRFAVMEAKAIIATLLQHFSLTVDQETYDSIVPAFNITMRPKQSLVMNISLDLSSEYE